MTRKPDYRSEELKMVIEFDGLLHYKNPIEIQKDLDKDELYRKAGYKVVRIPYFIQLTNEVVEQLFGVKVRDDLFPKGFASMRIELKNTPAFMCTEGVKRMAREFKSFPEQYETNIKFLLEQENEMLTGVSFLIEEYNKI